MPTSRLIAVTVAAVLAIVGGACGDDAGDGGDIVDRDLDVEPVEPDAP